MSSSKSKTTVKVFIIISLWLAGSIAFLFQSKLERPLLWTQFKEFGYIIGNDTIHKNEPFDIDTLISKKDSLLPKDSLPNKYIINYRPIIGNQGTLGSCTSWASAYAALTIVRRIETGNSKYHPFSATNLYNRVKSTCGEGTNIQQSLELLKVEGCKPYDDESEARSENDCIKYDETQKNAEKFPDKLYDFYSLDSIIDIKKALYLDFPVVFGIQCYKSDWSSQDLRATDGVWSGYTNGIDPTLGHAMCVIGYDDDKQGGAFYVMNSWGTEFGVDGYFWIKYDDFWPHVHNAYAVMHK